MLDVCREEQERSRRKNKWLLNNETLDAIRARVAEHKEER